MLAYTEQRVFACDGAALAAALPTALLQGALVALTPLPPRSPVGAGFAGRGPKGAFGLVPDVVVVVESQPQGAVVRLTIAAAVDATTLTIAVLLLVFCFPAALVCGALAYSSFVTRRAATMQAVWVAIAGAAGVAMPPASVYGIRAPEAAPAT